MCVHVHDKIHVLVTWQMRRMGLVNVWLLVRVLGHVVTRRQGSEQWVLVQVVWGVGACGHMQAMVCVVAWVLVRQLEHVLVTR